jgi:hypothetical protein
MSEGSIVPERVAPVAAVILVLVVKTIYRAGDDGGIERMDDSPGRPSSGVRPMEVSTLLPFWMAHAEAPLPRWRTTSDVCSAGLRRKAATARRMYAYERPWKPYLRSPRGRATAGSIA